MNEIILAYGLGVVSVGVTILMRVVLRADKKVTELEQVIENSMRDHQTSIQDVYREIEAAGRNVTYQNQELDRKIDSRIDKLDFRITDQLNYIKEQICSGLLINCLTRQGTSNLLLRIYHSVGRSFFISIYKYGVYYRVCY